MGKWVLLLLAAMVVLAIVGFVVDVARFFVGLAFVVCLALLAWRFLVGRRTP
jgi:hypothetical protein